MSNYNEKVFQELLDLARSYDRSKFVSVDELVAITLWKYVYLNYNFLTELEMVVKISSLEMIYGEKLLKALA